MLSDFSAWSYPLQAFAATCFTWCVTALGAAVVIFFKKVNKNILNAMLGFAAGVMTAASFWSLLSPAAAMCNTLGIGAWQTVVSGFLCGGLALFACDKIFMNKRIFFGINEKARRSLMLILSITLHNIPEGLAVGVAFGSLAYGLDGATFASACLLAFGIGLQNFPEGAAVSVPLRREGMSRPKAFFYGQLSAVVEPIAGFLGAVAVLYARLFLPFMLAFAAGAMIYVVFQELVPESRSDEKNNLTALFTLIGFSVMMLLDMALG